MLHSENQKLGFPRFALLTEIRGTQNVDPVDL